MELLINPISFDLIEQGHKTVETRLGNDPVLCKVVEGDTLMIVNRDDQRRLVRTVVAVRPYHSSEEVAAHETLANLGDYSSSAAYVERMRQFQSADDEVQHGILAVELG